VVNKVILIGNLGKDPEVRFTPNGKALAKFSVATSEKWTDQQGQKQERTEWHNVVVWGKLRPVSFEGPAGIRRRLDSVTQLRRQGRQQEIHHRDRRARRPLPWWWWRWRRQPRSARQQRQRPAR